MTTKSMSAVVGAAMLAASIGCARETPLAPGGLSSDISMAASELTSSSIPVITLRSDLTVDPFETTVAAGSVAKFVNSSGRYAKVHSYNCSEFSGVNLPNGGWVYTWEFKPANKTCDFFVWDVNWTRKIFQGKVVVR